MCWSSFRLHSLWEEGGPTLSHELTQRRKTNSSFSKAEIYRIAGQLAAGMASL